MKKIPDKVYVRNRIDTIQYIAKIKMEDGGLIEVSLTEMEYIANAWKIFQKQTGYKGVK